MKSSICLILLVFIFIKVSAQESKNINCYLGGELMVGNFLGGGINFCLLFNENFLIQTGLSNYGTTNKSKPPDFSPGIVSALFTLGLSEIDLDDIKNYHILAGKVVAKNERGTLRFIIAGGIAYSTIEGAINWKRVEDYEGFGPNYTHEIGKKSTISFLINPKLELPFSRYIGLTCNPLIQINSERVFVGLGLGIILGKLRQ